MIGQHGFENNGLPTRIVAVIFCVVKKVEFFGVLKLCVFRLLLEADMQVSGRICGLRPAVVEACRGQHE